MNLQPAIAKGNGKVIFSSTAPGDRTFQVDDNRFDNGWEITNPSGRGEFVGV